MDGSPDRRRSLRIGLALLVVVSAATASTVDLIQSRSEVDRWVADQAGLVEAVVHDVIGDVFNDLEAVAAFVEESDPSTESFDSFIDRIAGTASAVGFGYVTVVAAEDLEAYRRQEEEVHGEDFELSGLDSTGGLTPLDRDGRTEFFPVQLFSVGEMLQPYVEGGIVTEEFGAGLDVGWDPVWRGDVSRAVALDGPMLSQFIDIKLDMITLDRLFFASVPVRTDGGAARGLVLTLMLEPLLLRDLDNRALEDVRWEVVEMGGAPTRVSAEEARIYPLQMPGTAWSLAIAPTDEALADLLGRPWWGAGLIAGTLASLASMILWLVIDRRDEHKSVAQFKQAAADKDRFLAAVSHELRTPLTVVSGVANELRDRPASFSAEEQSGLLDMLVEQTDELSGIVEDLLVAARSDIGKVAIHWEETDLRAEAERAMQTAGVVAELHGGERTARADSYRVRQIIRNLLTNAKRYGGPTIRVEFSREPGWVDVVVADDGAGILPEQRTTIFESYQSAHARDFAVGSMGLGLYISRNLAEAMGGDLNYEYDGRWSRFRLRLQEAGTVEGSQRPSTPTAVTPQSAPVA